MGTYNLSILGVEVYAASEKLIFTSSHMEQVEESLLIAEELTAEHFKLSSFDDRRYHYDVATLKNLCPKEILPNVLARLSKYIVKGPEMRTRSFFRICLQDNNILSRFHLYKGAANFNSLMLFILTHELVHIVRFGKYLQCFDVDKVHHPDEERRVDQITEKILRPLKRTDINTLLDHYNS